MPNVNWFDPDKYDLEAIQLEGNTGWSYRVKLYGGRFTKVGSYVSKKAAYAAGEKWLREKVHNEREV